MLPHVVGHICPSRDTHCAMAGPQVFKVNCIPRVKPSARHNETSKRLTFVKCIRWRKPSVGLPTLDPPCSCRLVYKVWLKPVSERDKDIIYSPEYRMQFKMITPFDLNMRQKVSKSASVSLVKTYQSVSSRSTNSVPSALITKVRKFQTKFYFGTETVCQRIPEFLLETFDKIGEYKLTFGLVIE